MGAENPIFIAYCYPDQKWVGRLQSAISAASPSTRIVLWDDRKCRDGSRWRSELPAILHDCGVAIMLVSERFLESPCMVGAKLPALLQFAKPGFEVRWILISNCRYEAANLQESAALNHTDCSLDGLSSARREKVLGEIATRVKALGAGDSVGEVPAPDLPLSPARVRLAQIIEARRRMIAQLQRYVRILVPAAGAMIVLGLVIGAIKGGLSLPLMVAGFGLFVGSLALALKTRIEFVDQSIVAARCVMIGLADDTLPERQRGVLSQKANEILADF